MSKTFRLSLRQYHPKPKDHSNILRDFLYNNEILNNSSSKLLISITHNHPIRSVAKRFNKTQMKSLDIVNLKGKALSYRKKSNKSKMRNYDHNLNLRDIISTQQTSYNDQLRQVLTKSSKKTSISNCSYDKPLMTYEKYCQLLTQQVYLLQNTITHLKEEKRDLETKEISINEGISEENKLLSEIKSYDNIANKCKVNCSELIKEIQKLRENLDNYKITPSPPLLHYLSEMITEPYEKIVLRMK